MSRSRRTCQRYFKPSNVQREDDVKNIVYVLGTVAVVCFVAGLLPAAAAPPPPPARACAGGTVSGRITDAQGAGIATANITATPRDGSLSSFHAVDAQGNFSLCLAPGDYGLHFAADSYIAEMYDNAAYGCADAVAATAGGSTTGINAVLEKGGVIAGQVTDGGTPLQNVAVSVEGIDVTAGGSAFTDAAGNYAVTGLRTGSYTVHFEGININHSAEVYNNRLLSGTPDAVAVTAPDTTSGIDADLPTGGSIIGGIGNGLTGAPGVRVLAYDAGGAVVRTATTDGLGAFFLNGLRAGDYKLFFEGQQTGLRNEWYIDRTDMESADPVSVVNGQPSLLLAELSLGGAISGNILEGAGPTPSYIAFAFDDSGNLAGWDSTDILGDYTIGGLPAGSYRVFVRRDHGGAISSWYENGNSMTDATRIAVSPPAGVTGIDFLIPSLPTAPVGGRLTFEGNACNGRAFVSIYPTDPVNDNWSYGEAIVGPMGDWNSMLPFGSYRLLAGSGEASSHRDTWYRPSPAFPRSRPLRIDDGQGNSGVDFLLPLKESGPLPDISVGGFDHVLPLGPGDEQPVTFSLECNGNLGEPLDWWALLTTKLPPPWNILHYEPGKGWVPGLEPSYQGPCRNIAGRRLKPFTYTSKVGKVDMYVGVDGMNGDLDLPSLIFDGLRLNMLP